MDLALNFGIEEYQTPAGGCLLTDPGFSERLRDLMRLAPDFDANDLELLKLGRHFIMEDVKLVIGRNGWENDRLEEVVRPGDVLLCEAARPGPTALIRHYGPASDEARVMSEAARLLGLYGKGKTPLNASEVRVIERNSATEAGNS
jgi:hypothetical protein